MNNIIGKLLSLLKDKTIIVIILSVIILGAGITTYFVLQDNGKTNQQVSSVEESKTDEPKQEDKNFL